MTPRQPHLDPQPALLPLQDANADGNRRVSKLLSAAFRGDIPRVSRLVDKMCESGKSLDEVVASHQLSGRERCGPLHMAATGGEIRMCSFLISCCSCDVNAVDYYGETPLHYAVECVVRPMWHICVIRFLVSSGADPNKADEGGRTPLHVATEHSSVGCMKALIQSGAHVNAGPVTPLVIAARKGFTKHIKCLLEAGADANLPDENGKVPVEIAAVQGWEECVKILFPVTTPLPAYADWSIDGIIRHGKTVRQGQADKIKAAGDAAFQKKDYLRASSRYTQALAMDPADSTLYAKRSICFQRMNHKKQALADANTYRAMQPDLPRSNIAVEEGGAAMELVEDYCKRMEALMSGLNLGTRRNESTDEASKYAIAEGGRDEEAGEADGDRAVRAGQADVRFSGPEWASGALEA